MIRDQLLENIDLLLKAPDLFLVVRRVLFASLDNLLNTFAFDFNSVQIFVGSQKLGLHDLQLGLAFSLSVHFEHYGLIMLL
jgi:hypothetical protein